MTYIVTITERTPTPPELHDVNTYHVLCKEWADVLSRLEDFALNFGCLVAITITEVQE